MTATAHGLDIRILERCDAGSVDPSAWARLADTSCSPNPFYERWSLMPALTYLEKAACVQLVTVYQAGRLVCLFPVRLLGRAGLFQVMSIWRFPECGATDVLCEPGLPFLPVLHEIMTRLRAPVAVSAKHRYEGFDVAHHTSYCQIRKTRKAVAQVTTWEAYQASLVGKHRRENKRVISRALGREGIRYVNSDADVLSTWYPRFLNLERESWKFSAGSNLSSDANILKYFEDALRYGELEHKVQIQSLLKGQEVVAMSFRFIAQRDAYEIKTSYSMKYKHLYPGVVLELLNIRDLLGTRFERADSCSDNNKVVARIWPDEITIHRTIVFDASRAGRFAKFVYRNYQMSRKSLRTNCR